MLTIYILGPTNAGKSTFLDAIAKEVPGTGVIEVGKTLRAKYPPAYFQGQNNPKHTADEAWQIFEDEHSRHLQSGMAYCLVDGQPRDTKQVEAILGRQGPRVFLHLWAPLETRRARAVLRDGHDPEKMKLSEARLINDEGANYNVLARLLAAREHVVTCNTAAANYSCAGAFDQAKNGGTTGIWDSWVPGRRS